MAKIKSNFSARDFLNESNNEVEQKPESEIKHKKSKDVSKMLLVLPTEVMEEVKMASTLVNSGNKTAYILSLIKKDLEENGEAYRKVYAALPKKK